MPNCEYVRATSDAGNFDRMVERWRGELGAISDTGVESLEDEFPFVAYAKEIVSERTTPDYAVHVLMRDTEPLAFTHLNVASLPRTKGKTLRAVWTTFAPKFELQDLDISQISDLLSGQISALVDLALSGDMRADHVKLQLSNLVDRRFYVLFSKYLYPKIDGGIAVRGNWFHIDDVARLSLEAEEAMVNITIRNAFDEAVKDAVKEIGTTEIKKMSVFSNWKKAMPVDQRAPDVSKVA